MPASGSIAKGSVRLDIDEAGLEASLTFTPDPLGAEWNVEKIQRMLMDNRISQGYTQRGLDDLVQKYARSKTPITSVIVKGVPPEEPVPERVTWADLTIPDTYASFADEIFFSGPNPEIFEIRLEKIKKETKIKKPAALPFLPPKEEIVVTYETSEVKEKAMVNPETLEKGFAVAGTRIGVVSPSKPGKNGKSIFGMPVPSPTPPSGVNFLCGSGIKRDKNELWTETTGFTRIGENWVDVIPFAVHRWSIRASEDKSTAYLDFIPGDLRLPIPQAAEILAAAVEAGVPASNIFEESQIAALLKKSIDEDEPLASVPLSASGEALVRVDITPEGLSATLYAKKGTGSGKRLQLKDISAAINEKKLKNLKLDQVKKDILDFINGPNLELKDYPLAQGMAAGRGKDRIAQPAVTFLPEDVSEEIRKRCEARPELLLKYPSTLRFPLAKVQKFAFVQKGQNILQMPPAQPGTAGVDVFGTVLAGLPGNDPEIQPFENVRFSGNSVEAQVDGLLHYSQEENSFFLRIVPHKDAVISARVRSDGMDAYLTLEREVGAGKPLTADRVHEALKAKNIVKGIDGEALGKALREALEGNPVREREIARGKPPQDSRTPKPEFLVKLTGIPDSVAGASASVKQGQPVAKLSKDSGGSQDGWDVTGAVVKVKEGELEAPPSETAEPMAIKHDDGLREEKAADGSIVLIAARSGELHYSGNGLSVVSRRLVEGDFTRAAGPVRFPGEVAISGSVGNGAQLFAGGSIIVAGAMEAALLSAEGSVTVGGGIRGGGKAIVRAKTSIHTLFAEGTVLLSVDTIEMKNQCFNCKVKTNGRLSLSGERGTLVGGSCKAKKGIDTMNIGTESGVKTELSFGQDYLVGDQIDLEERETSDLKNRIVKLDIEIKRLANSGGKIDALGQEKVSLIKLLEKRSHRLLTLREKFEEHFPSEIRIRGTVYPGVVLESHGRYFEVKQKKTRVVFFFDQERGHIQEKPLT
jgi:uncharacterized protein